MVVLGGPCEILVRRRALVDTLLFDPFNPATDMLDRSVLYAQLDGGRAEETSLESFGEDLGQRRFELCHFLRVAG